MRGVGAHRLVERGVAVVDRLRECGEFSSRWLHDECGAANLTKRHLSPMVAEGVLERRYPERVNHPEQSYRVKPATPDGQ